MKSEIVRYHPHRHVAASLQASRDDWQFSRPAGLPFLAVAVFRERGPLAIFCAVTGAVPFVPGFVYILTIWHWKDRYKGRHSDLWGALLLIESSGWFKLVYLFRHLLPDAVETVRYGEPDSPAKSKDPPTTGP